MSSAALGARETRGPDFWECSFNRNALRMKWTSFGMPDVCTANLFVVVAVSRVWRAARRTPPAFGFNCFTAVAYCKS